MNRSGARLVDERGIAQCRRVDTHFVGPRFEHAFDVGHFIDASAYGERNGDFGRYTFDHLCESLPSLVTGCDVEVDEFVGALFAVCLSQFDRIARLFEVDEVDALDVMPSLTSRQGMIRLASIVVGGLGVESLAHSGQVDTPFVYGFADDHCGHASLVERPKVVNAADASAGDEPACGVGFE